MVKESLQLIKPADKSRKQKDLLEMLEEKSRDIIKLKLKNEQLREKELFARLQLDSGQANVHYSDLKHELMKQTELAKDLALQLSDVKFKLEKYEMQFDGLTRE